MVAPVGGALGCLGLALLVAAPGRGVRLGALGLIVLGACLLGAPLAPSRNESFLAAACVVGALIAGGVGLSLRRWPWALAFGALLLVPVRFPVHVGGSSPHLLLPLYVLAAGAVVQMLIETLQGDERHAELGLLRRPLAAFVLWTGLSLTWSSDVRAGAVELLAFILPLGVIGVGIARLPWSRRALAWLTIELAGMALLFSGIGFYQYATRNVFWNPKVIVGNAYAPFYRVNSVFWDPSVYGRFLMVAIIAGLVVVLRGRSLRDAWIATAALLVTWVGLLVSFSQSSFAGLIAALLLAAAVAWRWRGAMTVGVLVVVLLSVGISSPHVRNALLQHSGTGLNASTSGRASLVSKGIRIAVDNPLFGVGVGGFKRAYADRTGLKGKEPKKAASHNTAVTVAAESGFTGLALLLWLMGAAFVTTVRWLGRSFEHRVALFVGLALVAVFIHSLFYNAFFEDPMTWGLLGLAALASRTIEQRKGEHE
ncbi:MAG: O-antigen ligase family protein [Gaiellaceae bacterium]